MEESVEIDGKETSKASVTHNVVFVTAEAAPYSKTGGLGDVCGSLPIVLAARGHRVMVVSPRYQNGTAADQKYSGAVDLETSIKAYCFGGEQEVSFFHEYRAGVDWVFVDHPSYHRPGNPYGDSFGAFGDNQFRFTLLCHAACEAPLVLPLGGFIYGEKSLFMVNDWHAGLVPLLLAANYRPYGVYKDARSVLVIHNLAHQGVEPGVTYKNLGLPAEWYGALEWVFPTWARTHALDTGEAVNILKGAIVTCDRILTVSEGYSWEITTVEGGYGLNELLSSRKSVLTGITNGVDVVEWNPSTDLHIASRYSADDLSGKVQCKLALQKELDLPIRPDCPLIGFIGRLDHQKGIDLIQLGMPQLMEDDVQFVMLGSGDPQCEDWMRATEATYKDKFRGWVGFNVPVSHRITAGCDILLMPSRFEPCGLNQLYAMRYGTVPVVHSTGGLRDTVMNFNPYAKGGQGDGTGWTFSPLTKESMLAALRLACRTFTEYKPSWEGLMKRCMERDFTWESACFDPNEETSVIEELDEVFDLIKKTWVVLGINQMLHNLCFSWVLFHRYVTTGQVDNDLLLASSNLLAEVEQDAYGTKDPSYSKILSSTLSSILGWAEKRLLAYRDTFHSGNIEAMQNILSLGLLSAKILVQDISHEYRRKRKETNVGYDRVDAYIRSSISTAFAQKLEKVGSSKRYLKSQNNLPALTVLAQEVSELAFSEKEIFGPVFKRWHPLATGIAMATLHSCYGNELKQFVAGLSELTPDTIQVLRAADKLEKDLVQIAVEDSVDSEDGGKSIIREMPPYETEAVIANLAKTWIRTRVDRLREWVDRNLHQEVWNPKANKERLAPSAVEVLRIIDETLEAFFTLQIPMHSVLVPELMTSLDKCIQHYVLKAKSGCGTQSTSIPTLPALTRCSAGSKYAVFKKKERLHISQRRKSQVESTNGDSSFGILQLCVRINTLQLIRMELGVFEKRIIAHLGSSETRQGDNIANGVGKTFQLSASACAEGIQQLCEATAYKVVFHDLSHVLWDSLYILGVSSSRIEPFLQELEQYLEIISSTVHDRVRTRVITDVMRASFDGFLLVLLAGGPSRTFTQKDSGLIEEDFKFLTDLFWSNGDGLPADLIDKLSTTVKSILPLYGIDTDSLVEQFKRATLENYGSSAKSRLPMPPTTGEWNSNEPNTLLRVLCYRNDETAAKFLKKTYNLPKKL